MGLKELREQIARERAKQANENSASSEKSEERKLKAELFMLKHRRKVRVVKAIGKGGARVGRGLGRVAKMSASALAKAEKKASSKKKKKKSSGFSFGSVPDYSAFAGN